MNKGEIENLLSELKNIKTSIETAQYKMTVAARPGNAHAKGQLDAEVEAELESATDRALKLINAAQAAYAREEK